MGLKWSPDIALAAVKTSWFLLKMPMYTSAIFVLSHGTNMLNYYEPYCQGYVRMVLLLILSNANGWSKKSIGLVIDLLIIV